MTDELVYREKFAAMVAERDALAVRGYWAVLLGRAARSTTSTKESIRGRHAMTDPTDERLAAIRERIAEHKARDFIGYWAPSNVEFLLRLLDARDARIADLTADYLRRHKTACDRFEEIIALQAALADARTIAAAAQEALRRLMDEVAMVTPAVLHGQGRFDGVWKAYAAACKALPVPENCDDAAPATVPL